MSSRLELTGLAFVYVVLAVPALAVAVAVTTSLGLVVITVGLPLLLLLVPLNRALADVHRALAGRILGVRIETGQPQRWRDFAWAWMSATVGWVLAWIPVALALLVLWYAVFPFVFWVSPAGVFDMDYGLFTIDTQSEAFLEWTWLLVSFGAWWALVPVVMRSRARLDHWLLRDPVARRHTPVVPSVEQCQP